MRLLLSVIALFIALPATAQLYTCKSPDGKLSISQSGGANCTLQPSYERPVRSSAQPAPIEPAAPAPAPAQKPKSAKPKQNAAAKNYPTVSAGMQKIRDKTRGQILYFELKKEQKLRRITQEQIEEVKTAAQTEENRRLLALLHDQLHIHNQNITAIQQELARL